MHMELIKHNEQKKRSVYKIDGDYKKIWHFKDISWLDNHIGLLDMFAPGLVKMHGWTEDKMWILMNNVSGIPASNFEQTEEFVKKIYNFCLKNIEDTAPYAHGDWVLSNIIVNGDELKLVDWDNLNIYPKKQIKKKLIQDMEKAFGSKFNDATSI